VNSLLNKHQERRLEVTLYLVEQGLDEIAGYLRGELQSGEMYETVSDLSLEERKELLICVDDAKKHIARIKSDFALEARINDVRGMIMGYLSSLWESLHNTRPRNLKGFGIVAPELFETLDPDLMKLIHLVNAMLTLVSQKGEMKAD
jgi:hypothetical protein